MNVPKKAEKARKNSKDYSYREDTLESAQEKAKLLGLVVVCPKSNQLFIDIDDASSMRRFVRCVLRLRGVSYIVRPSPSGLPGHYHITLAMPRTVTPLERIALQAILGSDSMRELLSWLRLGG